MRKLPYLGEVFCLAAEYIGEKIFVKPCNEPYWDFYLITLIYSGTIVEEIKLKECSCMLPGA